MTQKNLIEKAVVSFVGMVNCSNVVATLNEKREWLSPWVNKVIDRDLPDNIIVTTILYSLFDDCVLEAGETVASKSTAVWCDAIGAPNNFGLVLVVHKYHGHVWIAYNFSDHPLAGIEMSMMDTDR